MELDSNFHHTKYFIMNFAQGSNGFQVLNDIREFLAQQGFIDKIKPRYSFFMSDSLPTGIMVELNKKDSLLTITVGQIEYKN